MSIRCVSSQLMSPLLTWRNPQGREENWIDDNQSKVENRCKHIGKVIATEVGLAFLIATAAVETVAYTALMLVSIALCPCTTRSCRFFASLLASSSFVVLWGSANFFVGNPCFTNLMTREYFARFWSDKLNPTTFKLCRRSDIEDLTAWENMHRPVVAQHEIVRDILTGISATRLEDVRIKLEEQDGDVFLLLMTKLIFLYVLGERREEAVLHPHPFLQKDTITRITDFRREGERKISAELMGAINGEMPTKGFSTLKDKRLYQDIQTIASEELQGTKFIQEVLYPSLKSAFRRMPWQSRKNSPSWC